MTSDVSLDTNDVKQVRDRSLWTGVVLAIFGVVAITLPIVSTIFVETWIALILASAGATKLFYAYQTRAQGGTLWKVLLGVLYIATGIMLFINPRTGILTLTLLLGSFLLTEGVFELILAFRLRPQQNWTWALGNGIVTLLLGAMIWFQFPFDAPWLLGTLVGASILFTGISRIGLSFKAREVLKHESESAASA
ncbi:HdeD family acid-resistance protein [Nodosilinea sp. LEGE 06152]|uniref:HdeD family acid-resistance protein n=1 Tax=Nodosilinea sp. LEGE 06152 TaxID=2777966 RepID=UPI001880E7AD|nr:HdeD family acid-resistance protein [Nodosilinea sp. LEGE 06152]MBE9160611.1 HdeD family acid-resistance protein [Nodosilinea sp. LEGE 06152]